jgi:hypothetical protein
MIYDQTSLKEPFAADPRKCLSICFFLSRLHGHRINWMFFWVFLKSSGMSVVSQVIRDCRPGDFVNQSILSPSHNISEFTHIWLAGYFEFFIIFAISD